jgi:hypothetical protein
LLVAPHGGRRAPVNPTAPPPALRVNDLYTPEVTRMLARRLDAGVIINDGEDRNVLDLNRVSQVRRRARWYLALLADEIAAILARHDVAEVIVVHGWNTGQPRCDLGIGAVEGEGELHVSAGAGLTVTVPYLHTRLAALRNAWTAAGIAVSVGARYPASHPNNLLQLFTAHDRHADDALVRRIAAWSAGGRVNAWQLELGIPLRWPGEWRERFLGATVRTLRTAWGVARRLPQQEDTELTRRAGTIAETRVHGEPAYAQARVTTALQFYDPAADVGMFAGVGPIGPHTLGGRVLFFLGGQRIALFTGEEMRAAAVAPLRFEWRDRRLQMHFHGPMLVLDDAAVYLDLEVALANSRLVEATVALEFDAGDTFEAGAMRFGAVTGTLTVDGHARPLRAGAFVNAGSLRAGSHRQSMIAASFDDGCAVASQATADGSTGVAVRFTPAGVQHLRGARIVVSANGDAHLPDLLELSCEREAPLRAWPLSRMAILRGTAGGQYLRVTFGVARCRWRGRDGFGLYEHAMRLATPDAPGPSP